VLSRNCDAPLGDEPGRLLYVEANRPSEEGRFVRREPASHLLRERGGFCMSSKHHDERSAAATAENVAARRRRPRSLVLLNTGDGKGKSTAAFGVLMRALARGWRVSVIQFIKSNKWKMGEEEIARQLGADWVKGGDGFSWESQDLRESERCAVDTWKHAAAAIAAGEYDLIVLDEITYPINWRWIAIEEVIETIRNRPSHVNVVATGRAAPQELIDVADTATEMVKIKHAFDRGIKARRGIEF
jgi:cob(I)alamin adenosyltransferase